MKKIYDFNLDKDKYMDKLAGKLLILNKYITINKKSYDFICIRDISDIMIKDSDKLISLDSITEFIEDYNKHDKYLDTSKLIKSICNILENYRVILPLNILKKWLDDDLYVSSNILKYFRYDSDFLTEYPEFSKNNMKYIEPYLEKSLNSDLFKEINNVTNEDILLDSLIKSDEEGLRNRYSIKDISENQIIKYINAFNLEKTILNNIDFFSDEFLNNETLLYSISSDRNYRFFKLIKTMIDKNKNIDKELYRKCVLSYIRLYYGRYSDKNSRCFNLNNVLYKLRIVDSDLCSKVNNAKSLKEIYTMCKNVQKCANFINENYDDPKRDICSDHSDNLKLLLDYFDNLKNIETDNNKLPKIYFSTSDKTEFNNIFYYDFYNEDMKDIVYVCKYFNIQYKEILDIYNTVPISRSHNSKIYEKFILDYIFKR